MVVVDSYQDNGKMKLKATCNLPIDTKLENFYIVGLDVTGGSGLLPVKMVQAPVGGLSESYKILKLNCNSGARAGHLFFKMYQPEVTQNHP
jgi:hypothetical protein